MYNSDLPSRAELPSKGKLLRSTLIAFVVAVVLLATVVLPAEYGIDPTGIGNVLGLKKMGEIKAQLDEEAHEAEEKNKKTDTAQKPAESKADAKTDTSQNGSVKSEEITLTLKPSEGFEVKLQMLKGKKVEYQWSTTGGGLNHDTHGDGPNKEFQRYSKGRNVKEDKGEMIADFDGSHGWFWRNRAGTDVTVTLKVKGEYEKIKK